MGECYWNKLHPNKPQCAAQQVERDDLRVGNGTDDWTWCAKHHPRTRREVENKPKGEKGGE